MQVTVDDEDRTKETETKSIYVFSSFFPCWSEKFPFTFLDALVLVLVLMRAMFVRKEVWPTLI